MRFSIGGMVGVLLLAVSPGAMAQSAQQLRCTGNPDIAWDVQIDGCTAAIQSGKYAGSGLAAAFSNRGNAYQAKGQYDSAIQDFDQAIKLNPNFAKAFYNRGNTYQAKGQYDRAIQDFNQAIKLNPNIILAFVNRGNAYQAKGEYDRAIQDFDQAIRLKPNFAEVLTNRGNTYYNKGQYDRAIQDYDQAIKLKPNYADAFYGRGIAWEKKHDLQKALADFKKFASLAPSDPDGPNAIARITKALSSTAQPTQQAAVAPPRPSSSNCIHMQLTNRTPVKAAVVALDMAPYKDAAEEYRKSNFPNTVVIYNKLYSQGAFEQSVMEIRVVAPDVAIICSNTADRWRKELQSITAR